MKPADHPPPFDPADYVTPPTDPADEQIDVGVLIVGAGPAGLACAIRLGQLLEEQPELAARLGDVPVAVLEKGKQARARISSPERSSTRVGSSVSSAAASGSTSSRSSESSSTSPCTS